jgi:hypothetical protein
MENRMDFKHSKFIGEISDRVPYAERVEANSIFNFCNIPSKNYKGYENTFTGSIFYGLNNDDDPAKFNAILVDEACAFTLNINEVAIISKQILKDCIDVNKAPKDLLNMLGLTIN